MNKVVLASSCLIGALSLIGAFAFLSEEGASSTRLLSKMDDNHAHTVYFYGEDVIPDEYDEDLYSFPSVLSKSDAIVVNEEEKYPLSSIPFDVGTYTGTSIYGSGANIEFNVVNEDVGKPNYIAVLSDEYHQIRVDFKLVLRAELDEEKSLIYGHYAGSGKDFKGYFELADVDMEYGYYSAFASDWYDAEPLIIDYVRLVFSC